MNKEEAEKLRLQRRSCAATQQRMAANPLKSIWVEASAGTGKTKVLSDRVMRLLLNGVRPEKILCLTYTNAAAVEMNSRISSRLSQWTVMEEEPLEKSLRELLGENIKDAAAFAEYKKQARTLFALLLDAPGGLKIQTIHSFCAEILKRFPFEAGISPYFEVMDDVFAAAALEQIKIKILRNSDNNPQSSSGRALRYLTEHLKEKSFAKVMDTIVQNRVKIIDLLRKYPDSIAFEQTLAERLQVNPEQTSADMKRDFMCGIDRIMARRWIEAWQQGGKTDKTTAVKMENLLLRDFPADAYEQYEDIFLTKGQIRNKLAAKETQAADPEIMPLLQKEAERVQKENAKLKAQRLYSSTQAIFALAQEMNLRYAEYKKEHAKLDYTDLVMLTRNLLADSSAAAWVLFKLDGGIDHILVDEAQDTSPDQWEIIRSLSAEFFAGQGKSEENRTVFAVGDRKQSIYSFQGADPDKFDDMAQYFMQKAAGNFQKVNLDISFRSSAAVLDVVNELFKKPEVAKGVAAPNETIKQIPFRAGEFGRVEVWPLLVSDKKKADASQLPQPSIETHVEMSLKTKVAQKIAAEIERLMTESQKTAHPLHYSDFMVLVQRRSSIVNEFIRVCKERNINVSGADKLQLTGQIAVQDLISLGRFLLFPNDDLSLAEVLKSPLFGLNDDDLLALCYKRGNAPLWTRLSDFRQYAEVYGQLQTLLNMLDFVRPFELYNYVLTNLNGRYKFTERMGQEVEDSLDEFINLTLDYERQNIPSLQNFIFWISSQDKMEIKRETEQKDADAVRLMTVHGSKGLQAPIVFLPDTVQVKSIKKEQNLLWQDNIAYYPLSSADYEENCTSVNAEMNLKSQEEYRRLLYVALTRAEDRLYICGYSNNSEVNKNSWYGLCRECFSGLSSEKEGMLFYETPECVVKGDKRKNSYSPEDFSPERWMNRNVAEESLLAKPYTPSRPDDEDDADSSSPLFDNGNFYRRGTLIHKLLQFLPATEENHEALIAEYLQKNAVDFDEVRRRQIQKEVCTLLNNPAFSEIFSKYSHAEVPVIGEIDGKIISAKIDRLVLLPEKIMIIDFKTNRPPAQNQEQVPQSYLKQLRAYAALIRKIYPQYPEEKVETYILWTNTTVLMRVS